MGGARVLQGELALGLAACMYFGMGVWRNGSMPLMFQEKMRMLPSASGESGAGTCRAVSKDGAVDVVPMA